MEYNRLNRICNPPRLDQYKQIADKERKNNIKYKPVSAKKLLKRNMEEAHEENINMSTVDNFWNHRLSDDQRKGFEALSRKINEYNLDIVNVSEDSRDKMYRIGNPQEIENTFGIAIFGGTNQFHEQNDFETYVLTPFP
ncbi:hypothetical protein RhiirA1_408196 [Rhizophagus irregularis]|uniref:Uncharacterized protein n=2 Tax=Rhizophagus irregularis TaxID=588596 RepID=A0A2N0SHS8_9GLOM|nr:hypothetical protein RhiirA1_408196 [Rhizophagus irregularis]